LLEEPIDGVGRPARRLRSRLNAGFLFGILLLLHLRGPLSPLRWRELIPGFPGAVFARQALDIGEGELLRLRHSRHAKRIPAARRMEARPLVGMGAGFRRRPGFATTWCGLHTRRPPAHSETNRRARLLFHRSNISEFAMADDKTKTGKADRDRINASESYEVRDWAKKFGVSEDALRAAVKKAGPMAKDVAKALGKSL
jgi:hypothetical protein